MPYDESLAERIRSLLAAEKGVTEKKMFGGLGFMVDGHMAVAAASDGGAMLRVDPDTFADLLGHEGVTPMEMRGRPMTGWLHLDPAAVTTDESLAAYVARGVAFVHTLPPKA
jgi:TfoX/Sxy family transcriptional regulator of competence genes